MNIETIIQAIDEARRFIEAAKAAEKRLKVDKFAALGSKETAACRRASMDLTRALARLRRP